MRLLLPELEQAMQTWPQEDALATKAMSNQKGQEEHNENEQKHIKKNKIKKSNKQQQPAFGQESSFLSHALWGLPENTCSYKAQHPPQEGLALKHALRKKQGARFNQRAKSHTDSPGTFIRS